MKISGIVCEYNPIHNGHMYHLQEVRKHGADGIVAVMSGNFVQRGDVAVMDKFTRANLAIQAGVDLVLELPVSYATASAEAFAMGAMTILNGLGNVNELSFGSECGDIRLLEQAADACYTCKTDYADVMQEFLKEGSSYPDVLARMVREIYDEQTAEVLRQPNNTLAISYINELRELGSKIRPMTIHRYGAGHNNTAPSGDGSTASATYIRQHFLSGGDCRRLMPNFAWQTMREAWEEGQTGSFKNLERLLLYKLRTSSPEELSDIAEVGQGLEYRLYHAKRCGSIEELLNTIKTKRYPMARLRRILLHLLLDIHKSDIQQRPTYGRILAFNDVGRYILKTAKDTRTLPFSNSAADLAHSSPQAGRCAALESQASDIFALSTQKCLKAEADFSKKITITKNEEED